MGTLIGTNFAIINILIFIISIILGEWGSYKLMRRKNESTILTKVLAGTIIIFFMICFVLCTYCTPEVNLFRDFLNGVYGINNEK